MANQEKRILCLHQNRSVADRNCCLIGYGGGGVYHIQIADADGDWCEAFDPIGLRDQVDARLSDQGFVNSRCLLWPLEKAIELARWYYEQGTKYPAFEWRSYGV